VITPSPSATSVQIYALLHERRHVAVGRKQRSGQPSVAGDIIND